MKRLAAIKLGINQTNTRGLVWIQDISGQMRSKNNLAWKCLAGTPQFLIPAKRPFTDLQCDWLGITPIFKNFYVLLYIRFLSSIELKHSLSLTALKTLLGKVFHQTFHRAARRSRLVGVRAFSTKPFIARPEGSGLIGTQKVS